MKHCLSLWLHWRKPKNKVCFLKSFIPNFNSICRKAHILSVSQSSRFCYPQGVLLSTLAETFDLLAIVFCNIADEVFLSCWCCLQCCESRNSHIFYRLSSACVHDAVFQCVCFQNQCVWVDSAWICIYISPCTVHFSFLDCYHDRRALFPLSHQHQRCPFVSITHHFRSMLIQTHGS